jgi:hypothetical protein
MISLPSALERIVKWLDVGFKSSIQRLSEVWYCYLFKIEITVLK